MFALYIFELVLKLGDVGLLVALPDRPAERLSERRLLRKVRRGRWSGGGRSAFLRVLREFTLVTVARQGIGGAT